MRSAWAGILHAGKLHHDAVQTLALHHRLGHAQLVDTVPQGGGVLLDGKGLPLVIRVCVG